MAVTSFLRDHLLRSLVTPGTDSRDYIGRATTSTTDYLGRPLVAAAWAGATAYAAGDYVELSTGEVLVCVAGGTSADPASGGAEPAAPGYGNTVVDGTVTWEQVTG